MDFPARTDMKMVEHIYIPYEKYNSSSWTEKSNIGGSDNVVNKISEPEQPCLEKHSLISDHESDDESIYHKIQLNPENIQSKLINTQSTNQTVNSGTWNKFCAWRSGIRNRKVIPKMS